MRRVGSETSAHAALFLVAAATCLVPGVSRATATMAPMSVAPMSEATVGARDPVIEAAKAGNLDDVQAALGAGAAAGRPDPLGRTALHYAARLGYAGIVKALLAAGSPVDQPDGDGYTPLIRAAEFGHVAAVQVLLDVGANPDVALADGRSARSLAVASESEPLVRLFRDR